MFNKIKFKYYIRKIGMCIMGKGKTVVDLEKETVIENLNDYDVILNGNKICKFLVLDHLKNWIKNTLVLKANEVYLPVERPLPVKNLDPQLTTLKAMKDHKLKAMEYMISVILETGIKIGREMTENEYKKRKNDAIDIFNLVMNSELNASNRMDILNKTEENVLEALELQKQATKQTKS